MKFIFRWSSDEEELLLSQPKIHKALNLFDSLKRVRVSIVKKGRGFKRLHFPVFPNQTSHCLQWLLLTWKLLVFVLVLSTQWPAKAMSEHCPKSLPIDHFAVKPLIVFFWIAVMVTCPAGAWVKVGLKPELCCLTNELQRFYLLQNHRKNCVEFEFFLGLLKKPKFRQEKYYFNANPPGWQRSLRSG